MPNLVEIGQNAAEIWRFSIFQGGGRRHLGFFKFQIFDGRTAQDGRTVSACQIWSKSVKMRRAMAIFRDIEKHAYYQNYCIDSNQILHSVKDRQMPFVCGPNTHTTNPRWRTAAILENRKIAISRPQFDGFRPRLAWRRSSAILSVPVVEISKF